MWDNMELGQCSWIYLITSPFFAEILANILSLQRFLQTDGVFLQLGIACDHWRGKLEGSRKEKL